MTEKMYIGKLDLSSEEKRLVENADLKNRLRTDSHLDKESIIAGYDNKHPVKSENEEYDEFNFSKEEEAFIKRAQERIENVENRTNEKSERVKSDAFNDPDDSNFLSDTREKWQKMIPGYSTKAVDISYEIQKLEEEREQAALKQQTQPHSRMRRDVNDHQEQLFKYYKKALKTTTEFQEWRNVSGVMKRYPKIEAAFYTRNKHFKIVQEAKRKAKKQEIIQRYNEKTAELRKKYHKRSQYTREEVKKVKRKLAKEDNVMTGDDLLFNEFRKTTGVTYKHNLKNFRRGLQTKQYDGISGSLSELYYKDGNFTGFPATDFDSDKTVESNYINETLINEIGLKLNAQERKELNKHLKKHEKFDYETLAPHFYEDSREDFFKHEEEIFGQRATPLDPLDGLQLLPYILRDKTLPPALQHDNTIEEVIRNCKHLDFQNFRKLGEQKLARYVLKVHDRRRRHKNITMSTTEKDDSVISHGNREDFMKRITIKTVSGRLLYDHEKLYDKIIRNKFKYKKVIYNDSMCWAYRELTKLAPVYITIVPKKNLTSLGSAEEEDAFLLGHMFHLCQKLAFDLKMREGYRVVLNNGHAGNHNFTHFHMILIGGRQMRYPKTYDLSHWTSIASSVDHDLSTYADNFELSGRMADFFGSFGSLKEKRAKWLSSKYPKMCQGSVDY